MLYFNLVGFLDHCDKTLLHDATTLEQNKMLAVLRRVKKEYHIEFLFKLTRLFYNMGNIITMVSSDHNSTHAIGREHSFC